ncbi:unnamed protein product, partial [Prorocentrum cordatum]
EDPPPAPPRAGGPAAAGVQGDVVAAEGGGRERGDAVLDLRHDRLCPVLLRDYGHFPHRQVGHLPGRRAGAGSAAAPGGVRRARLPRPGQHAGRGPRRRSWTTTGRSSSCTPAQRLAPRWSRGGRRRGRLGREGSCPREGVESPRNGVLEGPGGGDSGRVVE